MYPVGAFVFALNPFVYTATRTLAIFALVDTLLIDNIPRLSSSRWMHPKCVKSMLEFCHGHQWHDRETPFDEPCNALENASKDFDHPTSMSRCPFPRQLGRLHIGDGSITVGVSIMTARALPQTNTLIYLKLDRCRRNGQGLDYHGLSTCVLRTTSWQSVSAIPSLIPWA
jgi:hypothetical protein